MGEGPVWTWRDTLDLFARAACFGVGGVMVGVALGGNVNWFGSTGGGTHVLFAAVGALVMWKGARNAQD